MKSKKLEKQLAEATEAGDADKIAATEKDIAKVRKKLNFKPIFGCEMYVANTRLTEHTDKRDTGRHLVVLAKTQSAITIS